MLDTANNTLDAWLHALTEQHQFSGCVMISKESMECFSGAYGYGFFIEEQKVGHGGEGRGISAQFSMYRKKGYMLSILSNVTPAATADIVNFIERHYFIDPL